MTKAAQITDMKDEVLMKKGDNEHKQSFNKKCK